MNKVKWRGVEYEITDDQLMRWDVLHDRLREDRQEEDKRHAQTLAEIDEKFKRDADYILTIRP